MSEASLYPILPPFFPVSHPTHPPLGVVSRDPPLLAVTPDLQGYLTYKQTHPPRTLP